MSTESVVRSTPEPSEATTSTVPDVDIADLDDKHLAQYRHPHEHRALVAIIVGATALVIGLWILQDHVGNLLGFLPGPVIRRIVEWLNPTRTAPVLLILLAAVWAMDVIGQSTKAWQLVARAVELTPKTFPQLAPIADELRGRFDLPRTRVFISRDAPPAGYTIGVREPYAIVFSAVTVGTLTPDEFKFVLGREMGHIKLRHTLSSTVLGSANMSLPAPFSSLLKIRGVIFGAYQHAQELSCDRIGVVATRDVSPALTCLIKQNLGTVRGAKIDLQSMAPQRAGMRQGVSGTTLKLTQILSPQPFTIIRLNELTAWAGEPVETPAPASLAPDTAAVAPPANTGSPAPVAAASPALPTVQGVTQDPAADTPPEGVAAAAASATAAEPTVKGARMPPSAAKDRLRRRRKDLLTGSPGQPRPINGVRWSAITRPFRALVKQSLLRVRQSAEYHSCRLLRLFCGGGR